MSNEHYHYSVSDKTINTIGRLAQLFLDCNLCFDGVRAIVLDTPTLSQLEHTHRDGLISYNRGGVVLTAWVESGHGSGAYVTKKQAIFADRMWSACVIDYCRNNSLDDTEFYSDDCTIGHRSDDFSEYKCEYLDESLLAQVRIFVDDDYHIVVELSVSYADAPYYRRDSFENVALLRLTEKSFNAPNRKLDKIVSSFTKMLIDA